MAECLVYRTEMEKGVRIAGVLVVFYSKQSDVSLHLARYLRRIVITAVLDQDIRSKDLAAQTDCGRNNLFVDPILPTDLRVVRKKPGVVQDHGGLRRKVRRAALLHQINSLFVSQ